MREYCKPAFKPADIWAVIAPPPTPNGDLHLGHLSGPYFGADVFAAYRRLRGEQTCSALSVDMHQSYLVTTAENLGITPHELCARSYDQIRETLQRASMCYDIVGCPNEAYAGYVLNWFKGLYESGAISIAQVRLPYSQSRQHYLFESYAEGWCPTCLARTCGNICEACGHPNQASDLILLAPKGGDESDIVWREAREFQLDLNRYRERIAAIIFQRLQLRPTVARLVDDLLGKDLPPFPLTFPSNWGLPCPFPDAGGLVLNVWAEMLPGHYYWLRQAMALEQTALQDLPVKYAQFLGFDNSFFYTIVHNALALAAQDAGIEAILPDALITNEFYNLPNGKFSTSQRRLIWAADFLDDHRPDEVRFFLAWSNPELQQSVFDEDEYNNVVTEYFIKPLTVILKWESGTEPSADISPAGRALLQRFADCYDPGQFSLREAARILANGLAFVVARLQAGDSFNTLSPVIAALAVGGSPLTPEAAQLLWTKAGYGEKLKWPEPVVPQPII